MDVLGARWLRGVGNSYMGFTGRWETEVVVPKVDADIVLVEPWHAEDQLVASQDGDEEGDPSMWSKMFITMLAVWVMAPEELGRPSITVNVCGEGKVRRGIPCLQAKFGLMKLPVEPESIVACESMLFGPLLSVQETTRCSPLVAPRNRGIGGPGGPTRRASSSRAWVSRLPWRLTWVVPWCWVT